MKRRLPLILSVLALVVSLASPVGARLVNVTNPMQSDLDAADHNIIHVGNLVTSADAGIGGTSVTAHTYLLKDNTMGTFVGLIVGGTTEPTVDPPDGVTMPGAVYVRRVDPTHGELWFKTGPTAADWVKVAG